jgi:hypothetical protein
MLLKYFSNEAVIPLVTRELLGRMEEAAYQGHEMGLPLKPADVP